MQAGGGKEEAAMPMPRLPGQTDRILIVDDDDAVRRSLKQALASEFPGLTIDVATNGMEGMKIFHAGHPAVVLIDLFMPVMNGEQACRGIERMCEKEGWAMPSVIFCTAHNPSREVRNFVAANPSHLILQKPVKATVLVEAVRSRLVAAEAGPEQPPAAGNL